MSDTCKMCGDPPVVTIEWTASRGFQSMAACRPCAQDFQRRFGASQPTATYKDHAPKMVGVEV